MGTVDAGIQSLPVLTIRCTRASRTREVIITERLKKRSFRGGVCTSAERVGQTCSACQRRQPLLEILGSERLRRSTLGRFINQLEVGMTRA
jgi:hypothetical protein